MIAPLNGRGDGRIIAESAAGIRRGIFVGWAKRSVPTIRFGETGEVDLLENRVNLEAETTGLTANFFGLGRNRRNAPAFLCRVTKQPCLAVSVAFGGS